MNYCQAYVRRRLVGIRRRAVGSHARPERPVDMYMLPCGTGYTKYPQLGKQSVPLSVEIFGMERCVGVVHWNRLALRQAAGPVHGCNEGTSPGAGNCPGQSRQGTAQE